FGSARARFPCACARRRCGTLPVRQWLRASVDLADASGLPVTFGTTQAGSIVNGCATSAAGRKFASPACDAVIVHEPARTRCTVAPLTVQAPAAENETGRPDV